MFFIIGILVVVLIDQLTKVWIEKTMVLYESIPVLKGIFHLTYIHNPNSAFGLLKFPNTVFIVIILVTIVLIIFFLRNKINQKDKLVFFSMIFFLGGSLGNMIDRLRVGSVIDFIDFRIWPIFNIADSAINIGLFLLILHFLLNKDEEQVSILPKKNKSSKEESMDK